MNRIVSTPLNMFKFILVYSKKYIHIFVTAFVFSLISSGIYVYSSIIVKNAVEAITLNKDFKLFLTLITLFLLLNVLVRILSIISYYFTNFYRRNLVKDLQISLFQRVLNVNLVDFSQNRISDYVSRITYDVPSISAILPDGLLDILKQVAILAGCLYIIARFDAFSIFFVGIFVILIFGLSLLGSKKVERCNLELRKKLSHTMGALLEPLYNMPIVRAYNMQEKISGVLEKTLNATIKTQISMGLWGTGINNLNLIFSLLMTSSLLIRAGYLYFTARNFSIGMMFALLFLSSLINQSISSVMDGIVNLKAAVPSFNRIREILSIETENIHIGKKSSRYDITIESLSFGYSEDKKILKDITLEVAHGEKVGLVGKSGAGKSTLIKILLGFYRNYSGKVYIGDVELRDMQLKNLREVVTYIPQEDFIFPGTIKENLLVVKPDAKDKEIIEALEIAGLYEYITSLPNGINTEITQAKFLLSGGERQRISIARAFLKKGEIFIFDEALGQVDSITEQKIFEAVKDLAKNKTLIVIAHRISTVAKLDRIFVLDDGKIIAEGPHEFLTRNCDFYKDLCKLQLIS